MWHFTALSRMSRETNGYFFVLRHAPVSMSWQRSPLPLPFEAKSQLASPSPKVLQGNAGHLSSALPKKNIAGAMTF